MIDHGRLAREFLTLAEIDSPSLGERAMADALTERLEILGFTVREDRAGHDLGGDAGNLVAELEGTLPGLPLLFSSHMDTVEPCRGKRPQLCDDGRFRGDGTTVLGADDLAGVCAILEAVRSLLEEGTPRRSLQVVFSVAEERNLAGLKRLDFSRVQAREGYVLDTSGHPGHAVSTAPGHRRLVARFHGRSAHAGIAPEKGLNAIAAAAAAIVTIRSGRIDEQTTANIGRIEGGVATNIVPDSCTVEMECRSFSLERLEAQAADMARLCREAADRAGATVTVETTASYETFAVPASERVVLRFHEACRRTGLTMDLSSGGGGSDANLYARHGTTCLVLACGMTDVHSPSESLALQDLFDVSRLVAELMTLA